MTEPVPFEVYEEGVYLHGTRAVVAPGEELTPAQPSNFRDDAPLRHVYVTEQRCTPPPWGAQIARGDAEPPRLRGGADGGARGRPERHRPAAAGQPDALLTGLSKPVRVVRELEALAAVQPGVALRR